jgi:hypothetical protein
MRTNHGGVMLRQTLFISKCDSVLYMRIDYKTVQINKYLVNCLCQTL